MLSARHNRLVAVCFSVWVASSLHVHLSSALDNGLARTPPMGFNSWNDPVLAMDVTEADLMRQADFMNSSGLKALGYRYVNTDSGWQGGRFPNGTQYSHPVAFPHGIAWLADYIHARGLLFGVYGSADTRDCAGPRYETKASPEPYEGSMYLEEEDAAHWAAAGVDSLHYDNCGEQTVDWYTRASPMRAALNKTGRPILFMNEPMYDHPVEDVRWLMNVADQTWYDIRNSWDGVLTNADNNERWWRIAGCRDDGSGCYWNGADYLEVGNGKLTPTEERSHFALWAVAKSPLILGTDLTKMSAELLALVTNPELIAINQDSAGIQGHKLMSYASPNVSIPIVEPCSDDNVTQRWTASEKSGDVHGHYSDVTIESVDGRCLSPAAAGPTVLPCENESSGRQPHWISDRGLSTLTALLAKRGHSGDNNASALAANASNSATPGDWRTVQYEEYQPEAFAWGNNYTRSFLAQHSSSVPPQQMWSYDSARFGRFSSGSSNNHMKGFGSSFVVPPQRLCLSLDLNLPLQVWGGPLSGGRYVLLLLNRLNVTASITARWEHLGLDATASMKVRDVINRSHAGTATVGLTRSVEPHGVAVFTLTPQ